MDGIISIPTAMIPSKALSACTRPRREFLKTLAALPIATAVAPAYALTGEQLPTRDLTLAAATMGLISSNVGLVMPETTEGPYYLDPKTVRSDLTEGRPGIPLRMKLQVVTADCLPVKGARVDLWHCDAQGNYSAFSAPGSAESANTSREIFLRGTQFADENGVVGFETIYPGWYQGRTTHIHYKVFLDERTVLTSQIFFPDALSEFIYEKSPAYHRDRQRDTLNRIDGIAAQAGEGAYAAIREQSDRYVAALVVGIDPNATWSERSHAMPGGMPPKWGERPPGPPPGAPGGPERRRDASTPIFPGA